MEPIGAETKGMNISDYVESRVERLPSVLLDSVGEATHQVHERTGAEALTWPLVAGAFWQSYLESDAYWRDLTRNQLDLVPVGSGESLMVVHGDYDGRFSLLLFSEGVREPVSFLAEPKKSDIEEGWNRANYRRGDSNAVSELEAAIDPQRIQQAYALSPDVAIEASQAQRFCVLVVPPVEEELTSVPFPGISIDVGKSSSTAGVLARDRVGRVGITTAAHAVPADADVKVGGYPAAIWAREDDDKYDCCFIEWPVFGPPNQVRPSHGPLRLAPRANDEATFYRVGSPSPTMTHVRAFNVELPYIDSNLQQTVRTDQVTARGDSGAALIDGDDYILGFAHSRSAASAPLTYSSWIWADAIFKKLGLTIY